MSFFSEEELRAIKSWAGCSCCSDHGDALRALGVTCGPDCKVPDWMLEAWPNEPTDDNDIQHTEDADCMHGPGAIDKLVLLKLRGLP